MIDFTTEEASIIYETSESGFVVMDVTLTPMNFLKSDERYARAQLYKEYNKKIFLELIHDRYNDYDNKALEVYYQGIFIGHIRKNFDNDDVDNTYFINDFCFDGDMLIQDISVSWDGKKFNLQRMMSEQEDLISQEQSTKRLYKAYELHKIEEKKKEYEDKVLKDEEILKNTWNKIEDISGGAVTRKYHFNTKVDPTMALFTGHTLISLTKEEVWAVEEAAVEMCTDPTVIQPLSMSVALSSQILAALKAKKQAASDKKDEQIVKGRDRRIQPEKDIKKKNSTSEDPPVIVWPFFFLLIIGFLFAVFLG